MTGGGWLGSKKTKINYLLSLISFQNKKKKKKTTKTNKKPTQQTKEKKKKNPQKQFRTQVEYSHPLVSGKRTDVGVQKKRISSLWSLPVLRGGKGRTKGSNFSHGLGV